MELKGTIKIIGDEQTFGERGFRKREMVLTTLEEYPQTILIEFIQDKCDLLDDVVTGQGVTVGINIRGREWVNPEGVTKYFNSIQGWKINVDAKAAPAPAPELPLEEGDDEESDDLPF